MPRRLPRFSTPPQRRGRTAAARGQAQTPVVGFADLITTDIDWTVSGSPKVTLEVGDHVVFKAVVKNSGTASSSGSVPNQLDVAFFVDGATVSWSDTDTSTLTAGSSVTLTANDGPSGTPGSPVAFWTATAGSHTIRAEVNTVGRRTESTTANNSFEKTISVAGGGGGPPPPPPPGGRQPIYSWFGITEIFNLLESSAGIDLQDFQDGGYDGHVITTGGPREFPGWMLDGFTQVGGYGDLYIAMNLCNFGGGYPPRNQGEWDTLRATLQVTANAANACGANGVGFDPEPYGIGSPLAWDTDNTTIFYTNGLAFAPIVSSVGDCQFYLSSDSSWPGSNAAQILTSAYGTNVNYAPFNYPWYTHSGFGYFLQGLIDGGAVVTVLDAGFQTGIHNPAAGNDFTTGVGLVVDGAEQRFPTVKASIMIWPDEDVSSSPPHEKSAGEIEAAVRAATTYGTGPMSIYSHPELVTGTKASYWLSTVLPAVLLGKTT